MNPVAEAVRRARGTWGAGGAAPRGPASTRGEPTGLVLGSGGKGDSPALNPYPDCVKRVLVVKLCCMGDIVQMTPAIRALRRRFDQAEIHFLCSQWVWETAWRVPGVTRVISWDEPTQSGSWIKKFLSFFRILRQLSKERYDIAFLGHRSAIFGLLVFLARIPVRAGFAAPWPFLLTHRRPFQPSQPEVDRYLAVAESLGAAAQGKHFELAVTPKDEETFRHWSEQKKFSWNKPLVALLPGGGDNPLTSMKIKRWPKEKFAELARRLGDTAKYQVLILGAAPESQLAGFIKLKTENSKDVFNLAEQTNLAQLFALLKKCRLVIGGDSGPLYLAAALGTPTLTLFGPSDPRLVAPSGERQRYLWKQVSCAPCYTPQTIYDQSRWRDREFICWTKTHACMEELTVNEAAEAALEMLGN
ncbi:MAG: lipopolysaccharide heptosyltransferase II [Elusimicrobia bacterium]|nr:lipopolysaccharide heptosyltransferase II [Elusimicrobiota bacterium]